MPSPPTTADNFKQFQNFFKRVADSLEIPLEEVKESQHKLLDILQSSSAKIALPIKKALSGPVKTIWQTQVTISPMCKRADKKYYVPSKYRDFLFSDPSPNSLVVNTVNE